MNKNIIITLLCAVCALQSCETSTEIKDVEKIVYKDATYDVKSISLSENSLLFKTKETALKSKTITINADSEQEIPANAYHIVSYDEGVATVTVNDNGEVEITPVDKGTTKIVVAIEDKMASCTVEVRTTYFDPEFAKAIFDKDNSFVLSDDGDIDIEDNADAIAALTVLNVSYIRLTSLAGVEYLTALEELSCIYNSLKSLDVTQCTQMKTLNCNQNLLTSLDVTKCTKLEELRCDDNYLTSLDVTKCTKLETLYCDNNHLTSLDVTQCTQLNDLACNQNLLTSLDVSKCALLEYLWCGSNYFTSLDLSNCTKLYQLICAESPLITSIDISNCTELNSINCYKTAITSLDLSNCTKLTNISCYDCNLSTLDISKCTEPVLLYLGLQKAGELELSLTQSQYNKYWAEFNHMDDEKNANVKKNITDEVNPQ